MLAFAAACSKYFFTHTELLDYTPESDKRSTARPAWLRNMLRFVGSKKSGSANLRNRFVYTHLTDYQIRAKRLRKNSATSVKKDPTESDQ